MEGGIEKYFLKIYSIQLLSSEHLNGYQTFNRLRVRARLKFLKIIYIRIFHFVRENCKIKLYVIAIN